MVKKMQLLSMSNFDYQIRMRQVKQKQEPFFVKRVRLRKSILKTNQILQTISNYDLQASKYSTLGSVFQSQDIELKDKRNSMPLNRATIDEFDLYTTKNSKFTMKNMNNIIKICKDQKNKEVVMQMSKAGLEARRIMGDPYHSRRYQFSADNRSKNKKEKSCSRLMNLTMSIDVLDSDFTPQKSPVKQSVLLKQSQSALMRCTTPFSPNRRNKAYLYERMANMELSTNNVEQNQIYQKRIRSYTDFLWKCMLAHNISIDLDLQAATLTNKRYKPCRAYIGFGNNSNMIKGLLKRRFWWTISEEMTDDCVFIWTQVKINKIYERQERSPVNKLIYRSNDLVSQRIEDLRITQSSNLKKRSRGSNALASKKINQQFNLAYAHHNKIWNHQDFSFLKPIFKQKDFSQQRNSIKQKSYQYKTQLVIKKYKRITKIEHSSCNNENEFIKEYYQDKTLVHNHLQNNFFLGNKKALFYNLRQYYSKIGKDIFNFVPLTFHIKQGFKDPQYKKFLKYYQERANGIKKDGKSFNGLKTKSRNIWIVKPGENSNQGRGITVIDEIYELDRIIKQATPKINPKDKHQDMSSQIKTFIVQEYIDRPFLYNERKFDIRHYMLITNLYGVTRAYWYDQGYIRTSAYRFNIHTFDPQIHLTNDAIQKRYPEYGRYQPSNKISYSDFQNYIHTLADKRCNFKDETLAKMKEIGKDAARSVFGKMNPQNQMHNFQIFGLDFMLDRSFKPWLIQINTNPCLQCVCPLLDRIIPYMVQQSLKLSIDLVYPPPTHYPNTSKHFAPLINLQTFKYELIFDSLSQGEEIQKLYSKRHDNESNIANDIGVIEEDQQFKDEGKQMKLEDFT